MTMCNNDYFCLVKFRVIILCEHVYVLLAHLWSNKVVRASLNAKYDRGLTHLRHS